MGRRYDQPRRDPRHRRPRRPWAAMACGLLAAACLSGPITPEPPEPVPTNPAEAALQAQLRRSLPPETHLGGTFTDAIDILRDASGANIFVNWKCVEQAGMDRNAPVSLDVGGRTFREALWRLLASVPGKSPLGYACDEGVVTISTQADLDLGDFCTRVYDVRDLLPQRKPGEPPAAYAAARQKALTGLLARIRGSLDPPPAPLPGQRGRRFRAQELSGQLVITETSDNQQRIQGTLAHARRMRDLRAKAYSSSKWLAPALAAVGWFLARFLRRRRLARRRAEAGCCVHCGYDLRSSPTRCPECGTQRAAPASQSAGPPKGRDMAIGPV